MIDLVPAARRSGALLAAITDDMLALPTPCPLYSLGDLVDHVDGLAQAFTDAATKHVAPNGERARPGDADRLLPGWRTRIPERLVTLAEAWHDPAAWEGMTAAGGIELPGEVAGTVALNEILVHGWDIARVTGQAYDVDAEQAERCIQILGPQPGEERMVGDAVAFGRPVQVGPDASPLDRLVATMGRDPSWTGPSTRASTSAGSDAPA